MTQTFNRSNDNTIFWTSMSQASDGTFMNSATVTATLYNNATPASPIFANTVLSYIAGSNGRYVGTVDAGSFPSSLSLTASYTLEITAIQSGRTGFRKLAAQVIERTT